MSDLAIGWNSATMSGDFLLEAGQLGRDDSLDTALLISLFTDARAREGDPLPQGADPRGWWGDLYAGTRSRDGDRIGSRLWLLAREKNLAAVLGRARDYAREACAWLIEDAVAKAIDIEVEVQGRDRLAIGIVLTRPDGPARERYDYVWDRSIALHALGATP